MKAVRLWDVPRDPGQSAAGRLELWAPSSEIETKGKRTRRE